MSVRLDIVQALYGEMDGRTELLIPSSACIVKSIWYGIGSLTNLLECIFSFSLKSSFTKALMRNSSPTQL